MDNILSSLRADLLRHADEAARISGERFFKETATMYGVKSAVVKKIAKEYFKSIRSKKKKEIFDLCEELWQSGYLEESFVACHWSYFLRKQFVPSDFRRFEIWVNKYITNWASCDTFCTQTIGAFLEMYFDYSEHLILWTRSPNRWKRRAAAVSFIVPARKGMFLDDVLDIAEALEQDSDDLVQKGYGWLLKEASRRNRKEVFAYVMQEKHLMPRTALRYAIEKMPDSMKKRAMKKN